MVSGGGGETIAYELHDTATLCASTAEQLMLVVPTGNRDPDDGVQLDETGVVPPDTVGVKSSATGWPSADVPAGAGHMIVSVVVGL